MVLVYGKNKVKINVKYIKTEISWPRECASTGNLPKYLCDIWTGDVYSHGTKSLVLTKLNFIILFPLCQCFTGPVKAEDGKMSSGTRVRHECCRS